jgi:hypothetical protein
MLSPSDDEAGGCQANIAASGASYPTERAWRANNQRVRLPELYPISENHLTSMH